MRRCAASVSSPVNDRPWPSGRCRRIYFMDWRWRRLRGAEKFCSLPDPRSEILFDQPVTAIARVRVVGQVGKADVALQLEGVDELLRLVGRAAEVGRKSVANQHTPT